MKNWEKRIRNTRISLYRNIHPSQEFRLMLISKDLEMEMNFNLDDDSVFEGIPIAVDNTLLDNSVVFIPRDSVVVRIPKSSLWDKLRKILQKGP